MTIRVLSGGSSTGAVGAPWQMRLQVSDSAQLLADDPPVVTVTLPDTTTALADVGLLYDYSYGMYLATYVPLAAGRYTARAVAVNGVADLLHVVSATGAALPTATEVSDWMGGETAHAWTEAEIEEALNAETLAQMRICRVPASYPEDLREALVRRTARNLHMRRQLTAEPRAEGDIDLPAVLPVAADPEVRRLEKPWRRLPIG